MFENEKFKIICWLIGPTLIALSITEVINSHIWLTVPPTQTYLAGSLWFVAGLSIIRGHNYWTIGWPVLITLIGWFAVLGGLSRMFFTDTVQEGSKNNTIVLVLQVVLIVIGIILTYNAYHKKGITRKIS